MEEESSRWESFGWNLGASNQVSKGPILGLLLRTHGSSLNDEALSTLMIEVEAIVNSRPLAVEVEAAISPSNLLTMKSKVVMPPPGSFGTVDLYSKRRWRGIQHITNEFWSWWRKKFLTSLQIQSKWSKSRRKLTVSDIVLLKTEVDDRNHWPMARVISCEMDKNGMVWAVKLRVGKSKYCKGQLIKLYYYWKMK